MPTKDLFRILESFIKGISVKGSLYNMLAGLCTYSQSDTERKLSLEKSRIPVKRLGIREVVLQLVGEKFYLISKVAIWNTIFTLSWFTCETLFQEVFYIPGLACTTCFFMYCLIYENSDHVCVLLQLACRHQHLLILIS